MAYYGIGDECAVTGSNRILDGGKRATEIRKGAASAFARPAIVALETAVVILGEDRRPSDCDCVTELGFDAIPEQNFSAAHFHRREKLPVGQHFIAFQRAADSYVLFHGVVIGRKLGVVNRPIVAVSISTRRFEIVVAHAVALAAPD